MVLDPFEPEGPVDMIRNLLALLLSGGMRLIRTGRLRPPRALREAWNEHGRRDRYQTLSEVRQVCAGVLPGAKIKKHLIGGIRSFGRRHQTSIREAFL